MGVRHDGPVKRAIFRAGEAREIRNERLVRLLGSPPPKPQQRMALDRTVGSNARGRRDDTVGLMNADTRGGVSDAVIRTFHRLATDNVSLGGGREAVRAN